jgi:hypothetical protein
VTSPARLRFVHPAAVRPGLIMALGVLPVGGFLALAPLDAGQAGISPGVVMSLFGGIIFVVRTVGPVPLTASAGAGAPFWHSRASPPAPPSSGSCRRQRAC